MKELVNTLSDPKYSFTGVIIGFYLFMKYYRTIGTVKFFISSMIIILGVFIWMMQDPNFHAIIVWPDNVPIVILLFAVIFFTWFSIYKAAINDARIEGGETPVEGSVENREKVWTWPNLVYTELMAGTLCVVILVIWSIFLKAPLEEPANPTWAPNPAKAPWYFLGLQEMLVYFDPWMAGVVLPGLIIVGLIAIPYIDTNPKGNGYYTMAERKVAMGGFLFGWLALWVYLIIIGTFLRGPNWTFYGPFEVWDFHKVVAEANVNLSEFFWIKGLGISMPSNIFLREIVGLIVTTGYYVGLTLLCNRSQLGSSLMKSLGKIRYYLLILLLLTMGLLPVKMYLRWLFNLKYLVAMPEFEFNL
ncbi:MAG: hypothetical protein OXB88_05010 [Bacteriovoracales bacterium]|nr:hypothetical protein [Bacteriovoracales bacterium]